MRLEYLKYSRPNYPDNCVLNLLSDTVEYLLNGVNLVAATNVASPYVKNCIRSASNSVQVEGFCGERFHQGAQAYDKIEQFCTRQAAELFEAKYATVQAWRCTNGLLAVSRALAKPDDTLMGLSCSSGGYYATSTKAHLIGKLFNIETYDVSEATCKLDYDQIRDKAHRISPRIIFAGDTSYSRDWDWPIMRSIADEVGAYLVADISQTAGLVAGRALTNPAPLADVTLFATYKTFRGPHGCIILANDASVFSAINKKLYPELQGSIVASTLAGLAATLEEAGSARYQEYQECVVRNSRFMAEKIAAHGVNIVTDGTDNHAFIAVVPDDKIESADVACKRLAAQQIFTNKAPIPFDRRPLKKCSGVRIGLSCLTNQNPSLDVLAELSDRIGQTITTLQ